MNVVLTHLSYRLTHSSAVTKKYKMLFPYLTLSPFAIMPNNCDVIKAGMYVCI